MCPECNGLGKKVGVVSDDFLDMSKSLNEGAVQVPVWGDWEIGQYAGSGFFDNDKKLSDFTPEEMDLLLWGKDRKYKLRIGDKTMNATYLGVLEKFERSYVRRDIKTRPERTQKAVEPYLRLRTCPLCHGARLSQAALGSKIDGHNIAELASMEVGDLIALLRLFTDPVAEPIVASLVERLQAMVDIGLDYLSLDRETDTLSGGESQRIKMVKHLGSSLVDVMYILDEPSIGLHPRDVHRLTELLQKLRDKGNTVIVVEHDPDVMRVADHLIDMGPGAGDAGGEVVFEGSFADLRHTDTLDRPLPRPLASDQGAGPHADRLAADPGRAREQPQGRRRRHPDGGPHSSSPASPAPARARSSMACSCPSTRRRSSSTSRPSASRRARTRRPTPASWTTSARRSRRPTRSMPGCSASTRRAPARTARARE